ncbi:unnamed protein product [Amoebophrya sp. A120]|nr:unnamed protein product [Amoebophrya sp. A120]|eukprot:GSA120T00013183001.1
MLNSIMYLQSTELVPGFLQKDPIHSSSGGGPGQNNNPNQQQLYRVNLPPADKIHHDKLGQDRFFETSIPELICQKGLKYLDLVLRFDEKCKELATTAKLPNASNADTMTVRQCTDWFERILLAWVVTNRLRNEEIAFKAELIEQAQAEKAGSPGSQNPNGPGLNRPSNTPAGQNPNEADVKRIVKYKTELRQFLDIMLPAAELVAEQRRERLVCLQKKILHCFKQERPRIMPKGVLKEELEPEMDTLSHLNAQTSFFALPKSMKGTMSNGEFQRHLRKLCEERKFSDKDTQAILAKTVAVLQSERFSNELLEPEALVLSKFLHEKYFLPLFAYFYDFGKELNPNYVDPMLQLLPGENSEMFPEAGGPGGVAALGSLDSPMPSTMFASRSTVFSSSSAVSNNKQKLLKQKQANSNPFIERDPDDEIIPPSPRGGGTKVGGKKTKSKEAGTSGAAAVEQQQQQSPANHNQSIDSLHSTSQKSSSSSNGTTNTAQLAKLVATGPQPQYSRTTEHMSEKAFLHLLDELNLIPTICGKEDARLLYHCAEAQLVSEKDFFRSCAIEDFRDHLDRPCNASLYMTCYDPKLLRYKKPMNSSSSSGGGGNAAGNKGARGGGANSSSAISLLNQSAFETNIGQIPTSMSTVESVNLALGLQQLQEEHEELAAGEQAAAAAGSPGVQGTAAAAQLASPFTNLAAAISGTLPPQPPGPGNAEKIELLQNSFNNPGLKEPSTQVAISQQDLELFQNYFKLLCVENQPIRKLIRRGYPLPRYYFNAEALTETFLKMVLTRFAKFESSNGFPRKSALLAAAAAEESSKAGGAGGSQSETPGGVNKQAGTTSSTSTSSSEKPSTFLKITWAFGIVKKAMAKIFENQQRMKEEKRLQHLRTSKALFDKATTIELEKEFSLLNKIEDQKRHDEETRLLKKISVANVLSAQAIADQRELPSDLEQSDSEELMKATSSNELMKLQKELKERQRTKERRKSCNIILETGRLNVDKNEKSALEFAIDYEHYLRSLFHSNPSNEQGSFYFDSAAVLRSAKREYNQMSNRGMMLVDNSQPASPSKLEQLGLAGSKPQKDYKAMDIIEQEEITHSVTDAAVKFRKNSSRTPSPLTQNKFGTRGGPRRGIMGSRSRSPDPVSAFADARTVAQEKTKFAITNLNSKFLASHPLYGGLTREDWGIVPVKAEESPY